MKHEAKTLISPPREGKASFGEAYGKGVIMALAGAVTFVASVWAFHAATDLYRKIFHSQGATG
jgi:hypothetical protein